MKNKLCAIIIFLMLTINFSEILSAQEKQENEQTSLQNTGLIPNIQQKILDYLGYDNWQLSTVLTDTESSFNTLSISGDGLTLVSGSQNGKVKIWNIAQAACCQTIDMKEVIEYVSISKDKRYIAILLDTNKLYLFDTTTSKYVLDNVNLEIDIEKVAEDLIANYKRENEGVREFFIQNVIRKGLNNSHLLKTTEFISISPNNKYLLYSHISFVKVWDIENVSCIKSIYPNELTQLFKMYPTKNLIDFLNLKTNWNYKLGICRKKTNDSCYDNHGYYIGPSSLRSSANNIFANIASYESWHNGQIDINFSETSLSKEDELKIMSKSLNSQELSDDEKKLIEISNKKFDENTHSIRTTNRRNIRSIVLSPDAKYFAIAAGSHIKIYDNKIQQLLSN